MHMGVSPCEDHEQKSDRTAESALIECIACKTSQSRKGFAVSSSHIQGQEQHRQLLQPEEMCETFTVEKCPDALRCHCRPSSSGQRTPSGYVILHDDQH